MQELLLEVYDPERKVSASSVLVELDFGNEDSVVPSGAVFIKDVESRVSSDPHSSMYVEKPMYP
jgi:hypothetical protein